MDNSKNRLNDTFFYGLYMDEEILKAKGVVPRNRRVAIAHNYKLRIANMATLLREDNAKAYGLVYSLTHEEVYKLYKGAGLDMYISESLLVECEGKNIAVLCCNLLAEPKNDEYNKEYFAKLKVCMKNYKLPIPLEV